MTPLSILMAQKDISLVGYKKNLEDFLLLSFLRLFMDICQY